MGEFQPYSARVQEEDYPINSQTYMQHLLPSDLILSELECYNLTVYSQGQALIARHS